MSLRAKVQLARMFLHLAGRLPAGHLAYLARRMRREKPHVWAGQLRINSFFPPFPSLAFDRFLAAAATRRRAPFSSYVAVTGDCPYRCPHCSYARRRPGQLPRERLLALVAEIKALGAATLGFTGGEPLLRDDLEDFIAAAGLEMATILFTTGRGLDAARAARLAAARLTNVTVGLESADPPEHDRIRGGANGPDAVQDRAPGAAAAAGSSFEEARAAVAACRSCGLYTAISTVATPAKLAAGDLDRLYALAEEWGAQELRLLPPVATGGWAGLASVMLSPEDRAAIWRFHAARNRLRGGPAVAALPYLESAGMFGCGAGYHHIFIDATGEVCPCDLAPLSFGSILEEPLAAVWDRMGVHFPRPRCECLMKSLAGRIPAGALPLPRAESEALCPPPAPGAPMPEVYRLLFKQR
ncbi:MAG: radical SAM protein [Planctomycetes bacterium]|nr:radical SAM protein [Planctomycetota bacterium]